MSDGFTDALLCDYQREQVSMQRTIDQQQKEIADLREHVRVLIESAAWNTYYNNRAE